MQKNVQNLAEAELTVLMDREYRVSYVQKLIKKINNHTFLCKDQSLTRILKTWKLWNKESESLSLREVSWSFSPLNYLTLNSNEYPLRLMK